MALILPGKSQTGNGIALPSSGSKLVLPGSQGAAEKLGRVQKIKELGFEARIAKAEAEQAMTSAKFLNVIGDVARGFIQGTAREAGAIGQGILTQSADKPIPIPKEGTFASSVYKTIYGESKTPITLRTSGEAYAPLLKYLGISEATTKKFAVPIGLFAGTLDLFPGFPGKKQILETALKRIAVNIAKTGDERLILKELSGVVKGDKDATNALVQTLKNVDNPDDVAKLIDLSLKEGKVAVNATKIKIPKRTVTLPPELKTAADNIVARGETKEQFLKRITVPEIPAVGSQQFNDVVSRAFQMTKENGGSTINIFGDIPKSGFSFAPSKTSEFSIVKDSFTESELAKYYSKMYDTLKGVDANLGTWEDKGRIYMDVSRVVEDEQQAVRDAIKSNQLGIYDLTKGETKYIKDYTLKDGTYLYKGKDTGGIYSGGNKALEGSRVSSVVSEETRRLINQIDELGLTPEKFYDLATSGGGGSRNLDRIGRELLGVPPERRILKTETTLLKDKIRNLARGAREGGVSTRKEIFGVQDTVLRYAQQFLPLNLRGGLLTTVRDANSYGKLFKAVEKISKRVEEYESLKAATKVLKSKQQKITFLKRVGEFNQTTIKDAKKMLGIESPIRKMNNAELDSMVAELKKRLEFKRAEGHLIPEVKAGATTAPEGFYDNFASEKTGLISRAKNEAKDTLGSLKEGAEDLFGAISTRLANIDPKLKYALRRFEYNTRQSTIKDVNVAGEFAKKVSKLPTDVYKELDVAMKNGFIDDVNRIAKEHGFEKELASLRSTLDEIYARARETGLEVDYRKNFFPRSFKQDRQSARQVLEYFDRTDKEGVIQKAISEKEAVLGRSLTDVEKVNTINTMLRGFRQQGITLSKTGSLKSRVIDLVTPELNALYEDSIPTIFNYIESVDNLIESRRFFGKHLDLAKIGVDGDMKDVVGAYVNNLISSGKISSLDQLELERILKARFSGKQAKQWIGALKNVGYLSVMGSPLNALTQINDLALAFYRSGIKNATGGLADALKNVAGIKSLTRESVGVGHIAQEFSDKNLLARSVDKVFKLTGLEQIDRLGKETFINGTFRSLQDQAVKDVEGLTSKLQPIFGEETASVVDDLKNGITSENVKYLLFNELADFQPIALSEVPLKYLEAPNGRIFYALKTYTIKQWDIYRREVFQQMKTDPVQGFKNLLRFSAYLMAFQATADEIKDFITGKDTSFSDRIINSVIKVAGFNRYNLNQATTEGVGRTLAQQILPPTQLADDLSKDLINVFTDPEKAAEISNIRSIRDIPVGGNLFYWWFGHGAETKNPATKKKAGIPTVSIPEIKIPEINIPSL